MAPEVVVTETCKDDPYDYKVMELITEIDGNCISYNIHRLFVQAPATGTQARKFHL